MGFIKLQVRNVSKPKSSTDINWSHPSTRGLKFVTLDGSFDLVTKRKGTLNISTIGVTRGEKGVTSTGASGSFIDLPDISISEGSFFSFLSSFSTTETGGGNWLLTEGDSASDNPAVGLVNQNGTIRFFVRDDAVASNITTGSTTMNDGLIHTAVGTFDTVTNDNYVYLDGKEEDSDLTAAVGTITVDQTTVHALKRIGVSGNAAATTYIVALWDRVLTPFEARSLTLNPWQLLRPSARIIPFSVPAAGGRVMSSLVSHGGLAGFGGIAGKGGGLAG